MNKYLKKGLIISASVLMFLSAGAGINNVSAHRRYRYRYHYRYHRHSYRSHNKYGFWKHYWRHGRRHSYFYKYKTGYYHYGHWVSYHHKSKYSDAGVTSGGGPGDLGSYKHHKTRRHHHYYDPLDDAGIIDSSDVETPEEAGEDTGAQTHKQSKHSHFQVKFRKISGPADDDTTDTIPANTDTTDTRSTNDNSSNLSSQANLQQAQQELVNDINQNREQNGVAPIQESPLIDEVANERAQQASSYLTHYDASNDNALYYEEDATKLGVNMGFSTGENLADNYGNNGAQAADNAENEMMYHDAASGWGHRHNILNPNWKYVGVGVAVTTQQPYQGCLTFAEDFGTDSQQGPTGGIAPHNGSYDPYSWAYNGGKTI